MAARAIYVIPDDRQSVCESRVTLPSVIVPSTSIRSSLTCAARFLRAGGILAKPAKEASEKGETSKVKARSTYAQTSRSLLCVYDVLPVFSGGFVLWRFEGGKIAERWATVTPPLEGTRWTGTQGQGSAERRAS